MEPTEALPDPDYVDQIDAGHASVISPKGDARVVALADLPRGVQEGHYVSGGQIVPPPPDDAAPIRARLAAGDTGGPINLDDKGATVSTDDTKAPAGTVLPPGQEKKFLAWQSTLPPRLQESDDYDLRGFFQKNPNFNIDKPGQHLTDEFKLPNHETFSNESKYYNDQTREQGGTWQPRQGGGYSFIPNNPAVKQRVDEDANGNRVQSPPALPTAASLDTSGTAQPAAVAPPEGVDAVSGGAAPAPGSPPTAPAPTAADAYIDSVIAGSSEPSVGGAPAEPAIPPTGPDGLPPDSQDIQKRIQQGTQDEGKALGDIETAKETGADAVQKAQDDRQELARQQAADLAAEQLHVRDRQAALDKEDADNLAKARDTVIPDFWESRQGDLVGAAITAALSGAAAGLLGSTHNAALEAIQHNVDGYFTQQRQKIDGLYKYAESKGLLNDKTRAQYAGELTDLMQQHAYAMQSAADRVQEVSDQAKGLVDQKQTALLKAQLEGRAATELQSARKIDIDRYDAETKRQIAEADMVRAQGIANRHRAGAGGGAGGADAAGLARAIRLGVDDGKGGKRPMTYDEQISAAQQYHVPTEAKAGRVSLKTVLNGAAFDVDQAAKEAKAAATGPGGAGADRLLSKEADAWRKENGLDAIAKKQHELSTLTKELSDSPHNGEAQALAIERAVSAARGGAASKPALNLALEHLGGSLDNASGILSKVRSGEIGAKQMQNFMGFINGQLGAAQNEGRERYDDFNKYIAAQPAQKQEALKAERGRLFSGLHGFGGSTAMPGAPAGGGSRTMQMKKGKYAGKTVTVDADNNVLSVQ